MNFREYLAGKRRKIISVIVSPSKKKNSIQYLPEKDCFLIALKKRPVDGEANRELLKVLRKHFEMSPRIIKGISSKQKIIEFY